MPLQICAQLLKPRNLRSLTLILTIGTIIFALYHLLLGKAYHPIPTQFVPIDPNPLGGEELFPENIHTADEERSIYALGKPQGSAPSIPRSRMTNTTLSSKYAGDRKSGKCLKIQSFKPDFDALNVYPNLEFHADWISGREYWNAFFEQRYKSLKADKETKILKVFVIPHSHNDPGWLKTFEQYYSLQTKHVLDNAVEKMTEFKNMSFLWSEISFLSKWWDEAHPRKRILLKNLVKEGRLEIVTGGWVMTDEATVNLYSMIDQLVEGHQWVKTHLNVVPKSSWSVDPFGHGSVFPYILKISSIKGMVIQRIHYAWKKWLSENQKSDFEWVQRWDSGKKRSILCHNAPFDIYSIKHSCGPRPHVCLNFDFKNIPGEYAENTNIFRPITKQNVKEKAELMLEQYGRTASLFPHNIAMISMGDDFRFTRAMEWDQQYTNYMKLFNYINSHKDLYNADVRFGTVADYFNAVEERQSEFPTFSGDFHVYSDIFSDGRPAYWSGYYGTRPFWKKFYRETENNIRGAEILFTFANVLSTQKNKTVSHQILNHSYEDLTIARRWQALFAHHDASTGTSKADTMNDYGLKLLEAFHLSTKTQITSIETILFGQAGSSKLTTDFELESFGDLPKQIPLKFPSPSGIKKVVLFNNLARHRYHLVKVVISTPYVEVVGPNGEHVIAQLNPILDIEDNNMLLSDEVFELTFLTSLAPLSLSIFEIKKSTPRGSQNAVKAEVYCKDCKSLKRTFDVNNIQTGDIQLNNERLQVLFDRHTGLIMSIARVNDGSTININMKFGSYPSVSFRSGAYLLMPDVQSEQEIPFPNAVSKIIIISGPISSEISVFHSPIIMSSRIMHAGDKNMLEAVYIQNQIDLGTENGEVYMRFDTDLKTTTVVPQQSSNTVALHVEGEGRDLKSQPTFYTDQSGFTIEKRVKIPSIRYEGNTYPVNTMAYIQDEAKKLRFSVLVDRSHGFASLESGRLESLIERRTAYDDSRGMGEGVTDNRPTISNYVLLLEKTSSSDKVRHGESSYKNSLPTLSAYHLSQELSYPAFLYLINDDTADFIVNGETAIFPLINQELPCDSHLINLRTMGDPAFSAEMNSPSGNAVLITQKLGYLCSDPDEKPGCGNPNPLSLFYPNTLFNGVHFRSLTQTDLAGVTVQPVRNNLKHLHDIVSDPFEINSVVVRFR